MRAPLDTTQVPHALADIGRNSGFPAIVRPFVVPGEVIVVDYVRFVFASNGGREVGLVERRLEGGLQRNGLRDGFLNGALEDLNAPGG